MSKNARLNSHGAAQWLLDLQAQRTALSAIALHMEAAWDACILASEIGGQEVLEAEHAVGKAKERVGTALLDVDDKIRRLTEAP